MTLLIEGPQLHTSTATLTDHALLINGEHIAAIDKHLTANDVLRLPKNWHVLPGFIDMHIHGVAGSDVMDATPDALRTLCDTLPTTGVTSFLASTMSAPIEHIEAALANMAVHEHTHGAELLGVHLEGPFLSSKYSGAQCNTFLLDPDVDLMQRLQTCSRDRIKMVTLAPEKEHADKLIQHLVNAKIIAAIGHTDADYDTVTQAIAQGCRQATHLFNAMSAFHQRAPNAAGALLLSDDVYAELITDSVHLHHATMQLAYRVKGSKRIVLVTDAMRAACLGNGVFDLGGQTVTVNDHQARLASGTLAGSVITLNHAAKHMQQATHCSLDELVHMTSTNAATQLGIDHRKGRLLAGHEADIVILDDTLTVRHVFCRGHKIV